MLKKEEFEKLDENTKKLVLEIKKLGISLIKKILLIGLAIELGSIGLLLHGNYMSNLTQSEIDTLTQGKEKIALDIKQILDDYRQNDLLFQNTYIPQKQSLIRKFLNEEINAQTYESELQTLNSDEYAKKMICLTNRTELKDKIRVLDNQIEEFDDQLEYSQWKQSAFSIEIATGILGSLCTPLQIIPRVTNAKRKNEDEQERAVTRSQLRIK